MMSPHHQRRRSTDPPTEGWRLWLWRAERVWQDFVPAVAVLAAAYAVFGYQDTVDEVKQIQKQQTAESKERIAQTCLAFERDALAAAEAYKDARRRYLQSRVFLASVPPPEAETRLVAAIRQSIPRLRAEVSQRLEQAKAAAAPAYCDEDEVGLPEPNPRLPDQALP